MTTTPPQVPQQGEEGADRPAAELTTWPSEQNLMILKPALELEVVMERLRSFQKLVKRYFTKDVDYGIIPGTQKPTLYKSGADKFCDVYGLTDTYEIIDATRNWEKGLFGYEIRCILTYRGTPIVVSTGLGSCSTWEGKFRWRNATRTCPECHVAAIIKGKQEFGGGWVCFKKKEGCGSKFEDNDPRITKQDVGRIENPDIHDQINNVLKSAKKRAKVDAVLSATRSSGLFTQDLDESPPEEQEEPYGYMLTGYVVDFKAKSNGVVAMKIANKEGQGWTIIAHEQVADYANKLIGMPRPDLLVELDCCDAKAPNGQKYIKLLRILKKDGMPLTEEVFESFECIKPDLAVVFSETAKRAGKTEDQVDQYLKGLKIERPEQIQKADWNAAIKWATQPLRVPQDLTQPLQASVDMANEKKANAALQKRFAAVFAAAGEKGIPVDDVKRWAYETFNVSSMKELTEDQVKGVLEWIKSM